ncbi:MAG TPA: DUF4118 domain-containing protein, partial [Bryobacteraceae bacterium]|nr:DUF4118 domain-containing protein [Bryobacteraceae bacterium]
MNDAPIPPHQATAPWRPQAPALSPVQGYGLGILSISTAVAGSLLMGHFQVRNVEVPFYLFAVALTAWYGGAGPAILALLLSCISFDYFFLEPRFTLYVTRTDIPYFVVFTAFATLVTWFSTVRRRVEAELRQARDKLEIEVLERTQQASLLNLTHDSIFVRHLDNVVTYWNRGAQELYGFTAEEAIGKRSHEFLHTIFPTPLEDINTELLRSGRWEGELRHTRADGTQVVVSSRWSLRRGERGQPSAIMETNNDITERRRREDEIRGLNQQLASRSTELEAKNKELEAFAYSISHDLRAPLRHMSGYAELLQKKAAAVLDAKSQRYMLMIQES